MNRKGCVLFVIATVLVVLGLSMSSLADRQIEDSREPALIFIKGGRFPMGDVFAAGARNELPVHEVELSNFFLGKNGVIVGEFSQFVSETGYQTSAESPFDKEAQTSCLAEASARKVSSDESRRLKQKMMEYGGTAYWDPARCAWTGYRDDATPLEINFRADAGEYSYLKQGKYRGKTTSVGSFEPNSLGLHDMSGNAWEWTGDCNPYSSEELVNPCLPENGTYALRGGRWGGDALEFRIFSRSG